MTHIVSGGQSRRGANSFLFRRGETKQDKTSRASEDGLDWEIAECAGIMRLDRLISTETRSGDFSPL